MSMRVKELLNIGQSQLEKCGVADAAIDSKQLYCFLMHVPNSKLILEYLRTIDDAQCDEYFKLLDRRSAGEPLQYIVGIQEFMGLTFRVNPSVLIPRMDTEVLVENAVSIVNEGMFGGEELPIRHKKDYEVLDVGCGSGAIGISIAKLGKRVKVTCSDISKDALTVAEKNASLNGVGKDVEFKSGDLLEPFKGHFKKRKFDMIISNPPYIRSDVIPTLQREIREHEPIIALDGGPDGLEQYRRLIPDVADHLNKEGIVMLEIGYDQMDDVKGLFKADERFENVMGLQDLAGRDRVVFATLAGKKKK
ncbi:MAG: peptide chain release factor N(5)-glutamine methyltransferase [Clostridiales bacterium]|nr:peptide chain release factor N(5)-glutamine methyltransferase [Clostridiales bacterium]